MSDSRRAATRRGAYEIVRSLGHGGMAEVFLARAHGPQGFEKLVVLKKILPHLADAPRYVRLFLDEAKLAASLDHPNIAQVHDVGEVDGTYCIAMEYVHGRDLRSVLERVGRGGRRFPIDQAVRVAREVAAALHHAHERRSSDGMALRIVHRDVSPSNIQISYDGAVKLIDFGVAKSEASSIRTRTGALKGKAGYMSPEQARCEPVDRRTDVYALGIVLWEMLTGQLLYDAPNELETRELVLQRVPPPVSQLRPDCPAELDAIVARMLAPDPGRRFQTAEEVEVELEELAREHRLRQSSVALGAFMQTLFDADARSWPLAALSTVTVTDRLAIPASAAAGRPSEDDLQVAALHAAALQPDDDLPIEEEPTRNMSAGEATRTLLTAIRPPTGGSRLIELPRPITPVGVPVVLPALPRSGGVVALGDATTPDASPLVFEESTVPASPPLPTPTRFARATRPPQPVTGLPVVRPAAAPSPIPQGPDGAQSPTTDATVPDASPAPTGAAAGGSEAPAATAPAPELTHVATRVYRTARMRAEVPASPAWIVAIVVGLVVLALTAGLVGHRLAGHGSSSPKAAEYGARTRTH